MELRSRSGIVLDYHSNDARIHIFGGDPISLVVMDWKYEQRL
jgi:hypothetical protein